MGDGTILVPPYSRDSNASQSYEFPPYYLVIEMTYVRFFASITPTCGNHEDM